jgi:hypothetical protein
MASKGAEQGHLDPAIRNTTLDSLKLFVAATPDAHKVEEWVSESLVRKNILADMAMGTIRWPRSLGRPDVQNLSDGFAIRTKFWVDVWHIGLDGSIVTDIAAFVPGVQPFVRDGVGDEMADRCLAFGYDCVAISGHRTGRGRPADDRSRQQGVG